MRHRLLIVVSSALVLTAFASSASMAASGTGGTCVPIVRDVDGQPWVGGSRYGNALTNETKFYRWIDHDHVCLGEGSYLPPRPSR